MGTLSQPINEISQDNGLHVSGRDARSELDSSRSRDVNKGGNKTIITSRNHVHVHHLVRGALEQALKESEPVEEGTPTVAGYDFNQGVNYTKLFQTLPTMGFQASHLGQAIEAMNAMIDCRMKPVPAAEAEQTTLPCGRRRTNCTIMLGYTSNMVSSGNREIIRYLAQHNMIDCIVSTAGGIEEDFMKCFSSFYMGDFKLKGAELFEKSHNRTGNLLVPNTTYCKFHSWLNPILDTMVEEQKQGAEWTPSKLIWRMGKEINNPESIYYWAYKNQIPVFSPAITDGAIGDVLFFHRHLHPGNSVKLDIVADVQTINDLALFSVNTGVLILGGGVIKHHILNANIFRYGTDYCVYVNTGNEFDGSDAGASPEEAISWGKIKLTCKPVKVYAEATVILPILVGETFAKRQAEFTAFNFCHSF
ncbi:deoxyhypusine synthase isoform X2 [Biomphalaria pfeifferi]|uniref:deoxyhypusine synthase n=1 Tax=Biomphalaria pfeifferi TaxID=112525 RepID=A0AAD8BQ32_BIOPF|nr:deoxyhypusine synthase isoform X2 [Biomphalaria pfeifferi]